MSDYFKTATFSMRVTVIALFLFLSALTVSVALSLQYYFSQSLAKEAATEMLHSAATGVSERIHGIDAESSGLAEILSEFPSIDRRISSEFLHPVTHTMAKAMQQQDYLYAMYIGYANGDFYELINLDSSKNLRDRLNANKSDRWLVIKIHDTASGRKRVFEYYNNYFVLTHQHDEPSSYYANVRPWYTEALGSQSTIKTAPYLFHNLQASGVTYAKRIQNSEHVFAVDISLENMSGFLKENRVLNSGQSLIFDSEGKIAAHSFDMDSEKKTLVTTKLSDEEEHNIEAGSVPFLEFVSMAKESSSGGFSLQNTSVQSREYTLYVQRIDSNLGPDEFLGFLIPTDDIYGPYMEKVHFSMMISLGALFLLLPVLYYFSNIIVEPVRILSGENEKIKRREFDAVKPVPSRIVEMSDLSDSMVSMAASIEEYQKNQQELMDSFIQLIALAIDEKSPYTAGHCERVPELAIMLAELASDSDLPAFKDFKLTTEEEWREFQIAAWLHDCGKVTTPEHVVDKGTKLETIYNRIHEIRMRFEVLWRDAEIEYWKGISEGKSPETLSEKLTERQNQIKEDYAFIARCNVGGEFMADELIGRVKAIAAQTWVRNLDDRLGLSPEQDRRIANHPAAPLPVVENLLADKDEHLISWVKSPKEKIGEDIKIPVPEYQANQGEVYNLCIRKGTLSDEERYRINEHVITTIRMLNALPFPQELSRIPEYAGGHHETLLGTGYPKKLDEAHLPVATRILALADVFEALTAADRPYKKAKTLSEAVKIVSFMVKDKHLDDELFKLMLNNDVHNKYAKQFLPEEQIDEVLTETYV
ncbi:hypothetical protein L3Q72_18175 [Vibrio sp. JC009]|uniref:HD domain-containing phosphohydrolase n=1 Tax=Vibrio sp. JC009 TaxID=2912314 RepID=UPI0023AF9AFE|nr:HD domain-containing phosphohydrolase [Vibrio sp. JC009]WED24804.1 hypothetical protein L3Q72_18175 [Vibrio sp. JC009]